MMNMDGRKLVVVLGGTVPASGGSERMSKLLKAGTFPRDSSLFLSPIVTGIESLRAFALSGWRNAGSTTVERNEYMKRIGVILNLPKPLAFGGFPFGANGAVSIPSKSALANRER